MGGGNDGLSCAAPGLDAVERRIGLTWSLLKASMIVIGSGSRNLFLRRERLSPHR